MAYLVFDSGKSVLRCTPSISLLVSNPLNLKTFSIHINLQVEIIKLKIK